MFSFSLTAKGGNQGVSWLKQAMGYFIGEFIQLSGAQLRIIKVVFKKDPNTKSLNLFNPVSMDECDSHNILFNIGHRTSSNIVKASKVFGIKRHCLNCVYHCNDHFFI